VAGSGIRLIQQVNTRVISLKLVEKLKILSYLR
jgi:hypothetical protein